MHDQPGCAESTAAAAALIHDALRALPAAPLCIGFSGGLDSSVLLHALATAPARPWTSLRALHIDHGLHPHSAHWAQHCQQVCAALGVPVQIVRVQVGSGRGRGLEAAAREARHAAFAAHLRAGEALVLAHHRDDQLETLLLRLLRGAATNGLAAMRSQRPIGGHALVRPLLAVPRAVLEDYAAAHRLAWIDDPSNGDATHERNRLRHRLLPLMRELFPRADAAIARSAALLAEDADRLAVLDAALLADVQGVDPQTLQLPRLARLGEAEQRAVLRAWLAALGLPVPPATVVELFAAVMLQARQDATPLLQWPGAELRRHRDVLYAMAPLPTPASGWQLAWDGASPLPLPRGFGVLALEQAGPANGALPAWQVGPRVGGERLRPHGAAHGTTLKHALHALGIPPWVRQRVPLLHDADGELLAAGDLLLSQAWHVRYPALRLRWQPDG